MSTCKKYFWCNKSLLHGYDCWCLQRRPSLAAPHSFAPFKYCHLPILCAPRTGLGVTCVPSLNSKCFTKPLKWRKRINRRLERSWVTEAERNKGWGKRDRKQGNGRWKLEEVGGFSASDWLPLWSQIFHLFIYFIIPSCTALICTFLCGAINTVITWAIADDLF